MVIKDIFAADVARDITPVIYFHEQDPAKVQEEAAEYIITGGYPESDPRHKRIPSGIHEQFVQLLRGLAADLQKPSGAELPAAWISGFYGSGKSSFAKLLGLSLDGMVLPDDRTLVEALLARDDSPRAHELRQAWQALTGAARLLYRQSLCRGTRVKARTRWEMGGIPPTDGANARQAMVGSQAQPARRRGFFARTARDAARSLSGPDELD